ACSPQDWDLLVAHQWRDCHLSFMIAPKTSAIPLHRASDTSQCVSLPPIIGESMSSSET
ncbi:hypothetical protein A2U01_0007022, partial [Trifolium medium]|nr:hypothetical protein [Trifolium medium]